MKKTPMPFAETHRQTALLKQDLNKDPTHPAVPFGVRLRAARKHRKMGALTLAIAVGKTREGIKSWERGSTFPMLDRAVALADALEVPPAWLLFGAFSDLPAWLRDTSGEGFGFRLRALRIGRGMKRGELSERTGLGEGMLSMLETGRRLPMIDDVERLAGALNATPAYLGLWVYIQLPPTVPVSADLQSILNRVADVRAGR